MFVAAGLSSLAAWAGKAPMTLLNLWEVERDGKTSHVLGTCHLGLTYDDALPGALGELPRQARVVITEVDLRDAGPEVLRTVFGAPGLRQAVGVDAWTRFVRSMPNMPAPLIDRMPAWIAASLPYMPIGEPGGPSSLDAQVLGEARSAGVATSTVETVAQQIALLQGLDAAFLDAIRQGSREADLAALRAVDDLCRTGVADLAVLLPPDSLMTTVLVEARNEAWLPGLLAEFAQGGAFVAVGVAHVVGPNGIATRLEAEGYRVDRMRARRPPVEAPVMQLPAAPPAFDDVQLATLEESLVARSTELLCGLPLVSVCLVADPGQCADRVRSDLRLCVEQLAPWADQPDFGQRVGPCGLAGVIIDGLRAGVPADPACDSLRSVPLGF